MSYLQKRFVHIVVISFPVYASVMRGSAPVDCRQNLFLYLNAHRLAFALYGILWGSIEYPPILIFHTEHSLYYKGGGWNISTAVSTTHILINLSSRICSLPDIGIPATTTFRPCRGRLARAFDAHGLKSQKTVLASKTHFLFKSS